LAAERGDEIAKLSRSRERGDITWDVRGGELDPAVLDGADSIVHLAGENIIGRWTAAKKQAILESRRKSGELLVKAIGQCAQPPAVLVSASAQGYYGSDRAGKLDEEAAAGENFVAKVCKEWEEAVSGARQHGVRVAMMRIGIVLAKEGGALAKLLPAFKMGLGGPLGNGRQMMSWIHVKDLARAFAHAVDTPEVSGPVNAVAPEAVSNREFTRAVADTLKRPACLPVPPAALRLAYGEMAEEVLLANLHLVPRKLLASGFAFEYPELPKALKHLLR